MLAVIDDDTFRRDIGVVILALVGLQILLRWRDASTGSRPLPACERAAASAGSALALVLA